MNTKRNYNRINKAWGELSKIDHDTNHKYHAELQMCYRALNNLRNKVME